MSRCTTTSSPIDFKALMERRLEALRREEIVTCPDCGYEFDCEDMAGLVTLWGDNGPQAEECPECEAQLVVTETVTRTYEVERQGANSREET